MFYNAKYINLDFVHNSTPEPGVYNYTEFYYNKFLIYCIGNGCIPQIHWFSTIGVLRDSNVFFGEALVEIDISNYIKYSYIFLKRYHDHISYFADNVQIYPGKLGYGILL